MAQYKTPLLHSSQDMMQELFEEINDYLGDKDKPVLASPTSPVLSTFNVSTEGEEYGHSFENTQNNSTTMVDHDEALYQVETPLQPAMFVESDEEDSSTEHDDTRNSIHIEGEQTVCMCYKCKNDETEYPGQQQPNGNTNYDKSSSAGSQLFPFKRRSKATSSFGGAVGNAKLAHIAGLVKQTLTSTPRDILPTTANTQERPTNSRHQSASSTTSISDKLISPFTSLTTSSSTSSRHSYGSYKADDAYSLSLVSCNNNNSHSQNDTFSSYDSKPDASYDGKVDYQDKNGNWMMMAATTPGDLATSLNWDTTTRQDTQHQSEPGPYKEQNTVNTIQNAAMTTPAYSNSSLEEKQQLPDDFLLTQQLPFLTPTHRIGEPHSIVLRTKLARDVGSHEDRINAYNNAYSHCIMARTDMVPWIKKQYSKGPPSLVLEYTPRPKKSSKSLLGLFKRHSKPDNTVSSTSLSADYNSNQSKLSMSSTRSSVLTDQPTTVSPQSSFTPSELYFPQEHQQPQQQRLSDATSFLLPTPSPSNDEDLHLSLAGNTSSKINKNTSNHTPNEHHRRSPSPSHPISSGKKKSKSLASVTEPVSILKKSSSMASVADGSSGPILKKSSSTTSFGDEGHSPGYRNKSFATSFGAPEDGFSNLKKSRSPSPNPSVESRRHSSHHRSPSPISYALTAPNSNNNHNKLSQLLCPPNNRSQTRQRSRSASPSPRPSSSSRSRSLSPMAPPLRRSSLLEEYSESPRHYRHHSISDYQRSPSPSKSISNRQYTTPADRHLSPRRYVNDNNKGHQHNSSYTSSPGGYHHSEKMERKVNRTRSSEHYDHNSSRYTPPIDIMDDDSAIMMMDRRSRRSSHRSPSPLHYDEEPNYLLPLEHQHMPRRVSSHRRLRSASQNHPPPLLASTGRRATDPSNANLRYRDRAPPVHRRRSMAMEEEQDPSGHYYYEDNGYSPQRQSSRSTNPSKRRSSSSITTNSASYQPPPLPLGKQQQSMSDALHDLCAFFQHLPKHVLANYLQDAGGDFFLAKDLCMEDIMANGI